MSNFIGMVFASLKNEGIDTSGMSTDEAVKKYNELQKKTGGGAGADQPTPAENKRINSNIVSNRQDEINKLKEELKHTSLFGTGNKREILREKIEMLEKGFDNLEDFRNSQNEEKMRKLKEKALKANNKRPLEIKRNIKVNEVGYNELPKVKSGHIRLFRGLETEFDPNYNIQTDDNPTNYESWTDSYDLAKAYGKNVIFMDVPKSQISNSVLNEDEKSSNYGDRNYIYRHNKPVGILGKSGTEFLLYKDHENYNNVEITKIKRPT